MDIDDEPSEYANRNEIEMSRVLAHGKVLDEVRDDFDEEKIHDIEGVKQQQYKMPSSLFPSYDRLDNADGTSESESLEEENTNEADTKTDLIAGSMKNSSKIDYILTIDEARDNFNKAEMRTSYEENLKILGLSLQTEKSEMDGLIYVKVNTPFEVLCKGAQLFRIKKPVKIKPIDMEDLNGKSTCSSCCGNNRVGANEYVITKVFDARKKDNFEINDPETFFSDSERIYITLCLLRKTEYKMKNRVQRGIDCLINAGAYAGAFPLHEPIPEEPSQDANDRKQLRNNWASLKKIFNNQPLDQIRRYFGEQSAFYFTWLGVYTTFLIAPTLFGIAAFIYGLVTFTENTKETCDKNLSNFYVCPKCDELCNYTLFSDGCTVAKFTSVFDNEFTPAVAVFICFWGIMFGEFWSRKQNLQMTRWHVTEYEEDENIRPEYASSVKTMRRNQFTGEEEPYMAFFNRAIRFTLSFSIILFLTCVVVVSIFGILVYRLAIVYALYQTGEGDNPIKTNAKLITTVTAAIINIVVITILGIIYTIIARLLTDLEAHRTQSSYEDSYTFKIIVFQFINYYGSLIYIAFFKGSFVDRPGHNYLYMFGKYKQDECSESGCFSELTIQLIIIMIGKQLIGAVIEMIIPVLKRCWNSRKNLKDQSNYKQWERDNDLSPQEKIPMFSEYLEMIIQYGFIIMFVAAFPLAPLFALVNNLFEIRLDAFKAISLVRRSAGIKAQDIGAWQYIVTYFTYFGIVTNAFIIAWTSDFIPRCVYRWHQPNHSLDGFNTWSMATFDISKMENSSYVKPSAKLFPSSVNITECRYRTFAIPAFEVRPEFEVMYWHVLCARWIFVIVFEHVCVLIIGLIQMIPDVTNEVQTIRKYEKHVKSDHEVENLFKKYGAVRKQMTNLVGFFPPDAV